jgi:methyl-accepting chemotaxis protein
VLATQTSRATSGIGANVGSIREATGLTTAAITAVTSAIADINTVSAAIAAAIEQQGNTTREIAASVQAVASLGNETAAAMAEVAAIAQANGEMSASVLATSRETGEITVRLREEVDCFLAAMKSHGVEERSYERIPGRGAVATLLPPGRQRMDADLIDISTGGAAFQCAWSGRPGEEIQVILPGHGKPVYARVARHDARMVAVTFRQDAATLAQVSAVIAEIKRGADSALAA